jgi:hypothetical protein
VDVTDVVWRKSSYSEPDGGDCVEVTRVLRAVAIRDSKNPQNPALVIVLGAIKAGKI